MEYLGISLEIPLDIHSRILPEIPSRILLELSSDASSEILSETPTRTLSEISSVIC